MYADRQVVKARNVHHMSPDELELTAYLIQDYAAPAMYRANRPQLRHRSVTCDRGGGGLLVGSRSIGPEHEGQLSGRPLRSLEMRWSAWAGLYVFGRGFLMLPPDDVPQVALGREPCVKVTI